MEQLQRKALVLGFVAGCLFGLPSVHGLDISAEDRIWLAEQEPILISYDPEFAPFEVPGADGTFQGAAAEFLAYVAEVLGIEFKLVPELQWPDTMQALQAGTVDLVPCIGRDAHRESFLVFSRPYLSFARVLIARRDFAFTGLEGVPAERIAVQRESSHHGYFRTRSDLSPRLYDTFGEALLAVATGEADLSVANLATATHLIRNLALTNLKIAGRLGEESFPLHMAVRPALARLIPLLDQALEEMPLDRRHEILEKWIPLPVEASPALDLTRQEREWLLSNPRIRVGWDPAWAPVEFVDEYGIPRGYSVDLLRRLHELLGTRFVFEPARPWPETLERLAAREIDLVSSTGPVAEREHYVRLTDAYLEAPVVLYTRPKTPYIRRLSDLRGQTLAVPAGYAEAAWIARDEPDIRLLPVASVAEGLRAVQSGRVMAFAGSVMQGNYYLSQIRDLPLVISGETGYQNELRIGVRSDWPIFVGILNKALAVIPESEKAAFYRRWVLLEYRHRVDYWLVLKVALVGGLGVLLFLIWNRRLAREVCLRESAEQRTEAHRQALEKSYHDLQELTRQKDNLTHMIVHDLRNPLTVICGAMDILKAFLHHCDGRVAECHKIVRMVDDSAADANRIVDTLLDVSRLEAGKLPLERASGSLSETARKAIAGLSQMAAAAGISVYLSGDEGGCCFDHGLLQRVFANLVSNAIKACGAGDRIDVMVTRQARKVQVEVRDTGRGIDPRYHAHIFEKFVQVGAVTQQKASSGIGLAFCKLAVEAHDGHIGLESTPGRGSCFWFDLPL